MGGSLTIGVDGSGVSESVTIGVDGSGVSESVTIGMDGAGVGALFSVRFGVDSVQAEVIKNTDIIRMPIGDRNE